MDIFIEASAENAKAVYRALADFGAPLENICPEAFGKRYSVVRIEVPPIAINILQHIDGVEFEQARLDSSEYHVDGVPARYISAEDLITNKLASGAPQDLADVAAIRRAQLLK